MFKNYRAIAMAGFLAVATSGSVWAQNQDQGAVTGEPTFTVNFKDTDIQEIIKFVADVTGKTIVVDPRVKGRVKVISNRQVDKDGLMELFRSVLEVHDFMVVEVGEVVIGTVRGIKPYGAFIDIGGVSGLLHISEISHDHIDTPHSVFNVNDEVKVMIIDLDAERGRISLSTKQLEPEPGDMVKNPQLVYEKAEEMAAKYREQMLASQSGGDAGAAEIGAGDAAKPAAAPRALPC